MAADLAGLALPAVHDLLPADPVRTGPLSGRTLIENRDGTRTETALPTDEAVLDAYTTHFGIQLDRVPEAMA